MDLGTFGAIIKFALELEQRVKVFYEAASGVVSNQTLFQDLAKRGEKRLKTLERVRRENVTEMILEPIIGLDTDSFVIVTEIPDNVNESQLLEMALNIEKGLFEFFTQAGAKIDFLIEAAYSFELLAEANEDAISSLS